MAEDLAPIEPAHLTPWPSVSSLATTQSKMEVVMPKGKGKKCYHQDLRADEATPLLPPGMVGHSEPCAKCVGSAVPCHRFPGYTCQKCVSLKVKCVHSQGKAAGAPEVAKASASQGMSSPSLVSAPAVIKAIQLHALSKLPCPWPAHLCSPDQVQLVVTKKET
ncbi:hypothetical protein PAXRUDRAFT_164155 [Paxillus rubicundulus Ve08.2h10]|uniref:Zn(2)-C6 fungal-type domain-containing protein n=1 Tax=Paxillus rubicundulus Ve08.2h10 TaxID=930991 RepID=A0A0D0CSP3_9AGAM|nr:hypothetical protein PAXRUDRAFT_164155 [Paxillus rubicundulus Ve08.2h10]